MPHDAVELHVERPDLLLDVLAPGVHGKRFETPNGTYFPIVYAAQAGAGDVGRFLDGLPPDQVMKFPCVVSSRLQGMLQRRGFRRTLERHEEAGEYVDVWVRP